MPPIPYLPQARALFERMTVQPDDARKVLINDTIAALLDAGLWSKIPALYFTAAHAAQAATLNWKGTSFTLVPVNAPAFTTDRGYMGDGSSSYLNTQWVHNDSSVATFTSTSVGGYLNAGLTTVDASAPAIIGAVTTGLGFTRLNPRFTGDTLRVAVASTGGTVGSGVTTRYGLTAVSRVDGANVTGYKNGANIGTIALTTSTGRPTVAAYALCANDNGSPMGFLNNRLAFLFMGAGLTDAEMSDLYDIVHDYLSAIGAD